MSELLFPSAANTPKRRLISLNTQLNFPHEDLNDDNAAILSYMLRHENGLEAHAEQLQHSQRYIHLLADRALKSLGITTRYAEEELLSFSRGFAGFEIISDLVHPPRRYNMTSARAAVEELFVDTRSFFDIQLEELLLAAAEERDMRPVSHDRQGAEQELASRHGDLAAELPNTYDVLIELGTSCNENMAQLQTRTMGAMLARSLQSAPLDDES